MSAILYAVPAGTAASVCSAVTCHKRIYWVTTGNGKNMPVDCDAEGGKPPTREDPGHGIPHWATCPESKSFKRKEIA